MFVSSQSLAIVADTSNSICGSRAYDNMYALFEPISYACNSGYYLPANAVACEECTNGFSCSGGTYTFDEKATQGLSRNAQSYIADTATVCANNFDKVYNAVFEPAQYNCNAGYYLPADGIACEPCPANNYCLGGTYTYNESVTQGISGQCAQGYSAPAGSSECTPNTIIINWSGADTEDVLANNAGYCTYGGDIRTPVKAQHKPGQTFVGWTFDVQ